MMVTTPAIRKQMSLAVLVIATFYIVISLLRVSHDLVIEVIEDPNSFQLEHCDCQRKLDQHVIEQANGSVIFNQTTCGADAFRRGSNQKIVGFSFYGDINSDNSKKKGYFRGILGNLKLMPKYYPGWVMRLYYDLDKADPIFQDLCQLACHDANLDICDAKHLPGTPFVDARRVFAMNWRFFPTLDPQVDVFVSRDLDSRFSHREFAAVQEWLNSNYQFHFMRDNPAHTTTILGSGWGSKLTDPKIRSKWRGAWKKGFMDKLLWAPRKSWGPDQVFLDR